jgi:hypothetical protein
MSWFGRYLQTLAVEAEFPAMVGAAQPAVFAVSKRQRSLTMRTGLRNEANLAFGVAESDEPFA